MADTKISEMAALAGADVADGDLLPIVDISAAAGAKNKTLTPVEARIALVTSSAVTTALGFTPADAAAVVESPTGTGYTHVTDGVQDGAAGNPLVVAATDANATLSSSAAVTGSGDATVGLVAQTATGAAAGQIGAAVTTLGNASFAVGSTSVTAGNATAAVSASAATGDASAPVSATVSALGNAAANTTATAATGDATATTTATATTGDATANVVAATTTGTSVSGINADAGAHSAGVEAEANDAEGATLEVNTGDDKGVAGQFLASGGDDSTKWTTPLVRHAAGVPSGAPGVGELPIAFDETAVTGGAYLWIGAAWVKCSTTP